MVKPPLFVQTVFGLQGGTGAHPEDVLHMKRTADRLFGDKFVWSVLGAGRNQLPIAAMAARWAAIFASGWKTRYGRRPADGGVERRTGAARPQDHRRSRARGRNLG
jgi:Uncharacterized conserved protein